jgi:ribosomal-protein-alanine N-acetyltransferase
MHRPAAISSQWCDNVTERNDVLILETERLNIRRFEVTDAGFIVRLLNEPGWLRYIGDKHIHSLNDAETYLRNGPMKMYAEVGFGLYLVATKDDGRPIGMCGLIKRAGLEDVDLGFAFLENFQGKHYAYEAAHATLRFGLNTLALPRIVAITSQDNQASIRLLERLGFRFESIMQLNPDDSELRLFAITAAALPDPQHGIAADCSRGHS